MSESRTPIHLGQADPRLQHNPGCLTLGAGESTLSVRTSPEVVSLRHTQSHGKDNTCQISNNLWTPRTPNLASMQAPAPALPP